MRQLILCCDGTDNNFTGGVADTAVVKVGLLLAAQKDPGQLIYYDPGVGQEDVFPDQTLVASLRKLAKLASGRRVFKNIENGYRFLMGEYKPGDQIFLFGFSRGAFTARSIAGLVSTFGVISAGQYTLIPTLIRLLLLSRDEMGGSGDSLKHQVHAIRSIVGQGEVPVQFLGEWDSVDSIGFRLPVQPTLAGKRIVHVRHALALDEQRAQFRPRLYAENNGSFECASGFGTGTLQQLWFRGAHCDVGGGYPLAESTLSVAPLCWMLSEACQQGLRLSAKGRPLLTEAAVREALQDFQPPLCSDSAPPRIHSQLHQAPGWALAGMTLRSTRHVDSNDAEGPHVDPVEHPSVGAWPARLYKDTVWARWTLRRFDVLMLLLAALCVGLMTLQSDQQRMHEFTAWRLSWWLHGARVELPERFDLLASQLLIEAAYTLVWAWLLSIPAARAFARRAGLRRAGSPSPRWLQVLGYALPLAVLAGLMECLFAAFTLWLQGLGHDLLAMIFAVLMSAFSAIKWQGLACTLLLILSGFLPPPRHQRPD